VEKLGPAIGIELTPEGLRRLASLLTEEGKETGLEYTYELDPRLRELLGLGPPLSESGPSFDAEEFESSEGSEEESPPPKESFWPRSLLRFASAGDRAPATPRELQEWIPLRARRVYPVPEQGSPVLQNATEESFKTRTLQVSLPVPPSGSCHGMAGKLLAATRKKTR
jgi:hypothetical protein